MRRIRRSGLAPRARATTVLLATAGAVCAAVALAPTVPAAGAAFGSALDALSVPVPVWVPGSMGPGPVAPTGGPAQTPTGGRTRGPAGGPAAARIGSAAAARTSAMVAAGPRSRAAARPAFRLTTARTAGGTITVRWNPCQAAVTFRVEATLAGVTAAARRGAVADVREAFRRLGVATGISFVYRGATSELPTGASWASRQRSAEIVVAWVDPTRAGRSSTLLGKDGHGAWVAATGGYAYRTWSMGGAPWAGAIGRGFVVVNARQQGLFAPGFGRGVTRGDLLLHELGHVVGLGHVASAAELMYPVIVPRSSSGYRAGDLLGLARLGRSAGCIRLPAGAWSDL